MNKRRHVAVVAVALAILSSHVWRQVHAAAPADSERRIEKVLTERLRSPLDYVETPLSTVLTAISEEYDIAIQFDEKELEAVAQSNETEVSITISNVTLRSALEILLGNENDLTYVIDNEVLLITSLDGALSRLEVRIYQVEDLVRHDHGELQGQADPKRVQALRRILVTNVAKDSWSDNKTGKGEVCVFASNLFVVTQTRRVHEQIEDALSKLRDASAKPSDPTAASPIEDPALEEEEGAEDDED
jgi:hypothetical protein